MKEHWALELNRGRIWVEMVPSRSINLFKVKQACMPLQMGAEKTAQLVCDGKRRTSQALSDL